MPNDHSPADAEAPAPDGAASAPSGPADTAASPPEAAPGADATIPAEVAAEPARPRRPAPPLPPSAFAADLVTARTAVVDAVATWLAAAWEQPILRALGADPVKALDHADALPALRASLRAMQAGVGATVEDAVGPLLDAEVPVRDQALIASVDAVALHLVGLIGVPLKESGFDPLGGGLERTQDGFRLKTMTEHDQISAALAAYSVVQTSIAAERLELAEQEREATRLEVERLWLATADLP